MSDAELVSTWIYIEDLIAWYMVVLLPLQCCLFLSKEYYKFKLLNLLGVASLAIKEWKCNTAVAHTTIFAREYIFH